MNIQSTMRKPIPMQAQPTPPPQDEEQQKPSEPPQNLLGQSVELLKDGGMFLLNEAREAGANDPALGLRMAANRFDTVFLDGTGDVANGFSNMAVAFVRGGLLGANVYRANSTFKNPNAKPYQKALDVARIATDLVGLAGAVMTVAAPNMADTGKLLTQFAYGADLVSHSVRTLEHGGKRINLWSQMRANEKNSGN